MRYMHVFSNNNRITEAGGQNSGTSDMGILSNVLFFIKVNIACSQHSKIIFTLREDKVAIRSRCP